MERLLRLVVREDPSDALRDWLARPAADRINAMEPLRAAAFRIAGLDPAARLEKTVTLRPRRERTA